MVGCRSPCPKTRTTARASGKEQRSTTAKGPHRVRERCRTALDGDLLAQRLDERDRHQDIEQHEAGDVAWDLLGRQHSRNNQPMTNQLRTAMLKGFKAPLAVRVTRMPRQYCRTAPSAAKSILRSIGAIISQISRATGRLRCATAILHTVSKNPGRVFPSRVPTRIQRTTQRARERSKTDTVNFLKQTQATVPQASQGIAGIKRGVEDAAASRAVSGRCARGLDARGRGRGERWCDRQK